MAENRNLLSKRLLSTFDISDEILSKFNSKGFTLKSEVQVLTDSKLQSICGFDENQLEVINRVVRNSHKRDLKCVSALEILKTAPNAIHTGSYSLDRAMGGGVQVSKISQIYAEGGTGKTQICMQCCVNVQLPPENGGLSGQALYIDTENNFRPERIVSMAEHRLSKRPNLMPSFSVETIKSGIHVISCTTDANDFVDCVLNRIEPFIDKNPKIRLIIVDSIAQHFRYDYRGTEKQKDYQLSQIAHKLKVIAYSRKVAVLIANQVTYNSKLGKTVPALGKFWQTNCNIAINFWKMDFPDQIRCGTPVRSEVEQNSSFFFDIEETGIVEKMKEGSGDWHPHY